MADGALPGGLSAREMRAGDLAALHELSRGAGWLHRAGDWRLALDVGRGVVVCDDAGRPVGSAMWFPMGADFASIGLVIVAGALQGKGAGRFLMRRALAATGGRDRALVATDEGMRLYTALGFRPGRAVCQHRGIARPCPAPPPPGALVRPAEAGDRAAIHALDLTGFGAGRGAVLDALRPLSEAFVLVRGGAVAGYAFCRPFGRGHVIGPVVAETAEDAAALVAPHVAARAGGFLRLDTREDEGPFRDWLAACGLEPGDRALSMWLGRDRVAADGCRVFGLATQALG